MQLLVNCERWSLQVKIMTFNSICKESNMLIGLSNSYHLVATSGALPCLFRKLALNKNLVAMYLCWKVHTNRFTRQYYFKNMYDSAKSWRKLTTEIQLLASGTSEWQVHPLRCLLQAIKYHLNTKTGYILQMILEDIFQGDTA